MFAFFENSVGVANVARFAGTAGERAEVRHAPRRRRRLRRAGARTCSRCAGRPDGVVVGLPRHRPDGRASSRACSASAAAWSWCRCWCSCSRPRDFPAEHMMHLSLAHLDGHHRVHVALERARASPARRGGLARGARDGARHRRRRPSRDADRGLRADAAARGVLHRIHVLRARADVLRGQAQASAPAAGRGGPVRRGRRNRRAVERARRRRRVPVDSRSSRGATCR